MAQLERYYPTLQGVDPQVEKAFRLLYDNLYRLRDSVVAMNRAERTTSAASAAMGSVSRPAASAQPRAAKTAVGRSAAPIRALAPTSRVTSSTSMVFDGRVSDLFIDVVRQNVTVSVVNLCVGRYTLWLIQDTTGGRAITFSPNCFYNPGTFGTDPSQMSMMDCVSDGIKLFCFPVVTYPI